MRYVLFVAIVSAAVFVPALGAFTPRAAASGPDTEGSPPDDLTVALVEMFATMSDVLSARQEQLANESHLGSRATSRRLQSAIVHAPDVSLRQGARPFVEGWLLGDD